MYLKSANHFSLILIEIHFFEAQSPVQVNLVSLEYFISRIINSIPMFVRNTAPFNLPAFGPNCSL